ncbi:sulfatase family protein [Alienimonas californiensis]|uniref:Choline-sulfatase n=1 Tax=Alienimonas californiensis TaxID=2527989 RepID=A0A517PC74_9PLAN|nr:sulfatase [Alienimonas californiensis]QDT16970.1 Choline-sulfatase [Alienimonas californiensis]
MPALLAALLLGGAPMPAAIGPVERPNVLVILADDHRYDALGFLGHPFLKTPHLDALAARGAHCANAVVTTSLCSPSRASILTGLYAHTHGVTDNYNPPADGLVWFPKHLQAAGYETAFVGKWHMGDTDAPQPGFDHWISFRGQGTYFPDGRGTSRKVPQNSDGMLNVNGTQAPQRGYITDELTDLALDWLGKRQGERPWLMYLSHKAVHSDFVPADRHRGTYADAPWSPPPSFHPTDAPTGARPRWLRDQRNSRHGVGFAYNLPQSGENAAGGNVADENAFDLAAYHRRYCEAILALDETTGRLTDWLEESGQAENTIVVYLGDNGFQFGEQGLIDKRTAYAASVRIPLLVRWPAAIPAGSTVEQTVASIDLAPTLLDACGVPWPEDTPCDGRSFLPLLKGEAAEWREAVLYEYLWEWNYPHTPTTHAVIGERWKYVRYHGVWDTDELFDRHADPHETVNLIADPAHQETVTRLRAELFALLAETGGETLPLKPDRGVSFPWRRPDGPPPGAFPARFDVPSEPPAASVPAWVRGVETAEPSPP